MDSLRAMRVFARVVDEGSFAGAARALDLAPAVVTRLVAELEEHLGARLMNRTTRRTALTEVGENYLERVRRILADVDEAEALAQASVAEPRGPVRLLMPPAVAVHQLAKHLPRFRAKYPLVSIEIVASGAVETVDDSFDLTVMALRKPLDGNFIARRLARAEVVTVAAPDYLDRRGRPKHPRELADHDVLIPPLSDLQRGVTFYRGRFDEDGAGGGETFHAMPKRGVLSTLNTDTNYAAALAGLGVAGLPSFVVEDALMEHALERVLPAWRLQSATLWVGMPTRQHVPARTRVMMDFLIQIFGGEDRDPWLAAAGCETNPGCETAAALTNAEAPEAAPEDA
ncbi:MAG TPA: LysR family transcriptional regulator [Ideonella sp.]|uniref:LysR family transcriptional regulator n=1 Tax=Ideonella sp. TaxID=1929293 RepID=UPI002E335A13|nr:LysR family transcriptional regulator [Ideonella sp.]HEX5684475.1 LysR family transcriptional regulator [Ideonella sp.]